MLTKTLSKSRGVLELLSSSLVGTRKLYRMPQRSKPQLLNTMVGTQLLTVCLHGPSQLSNFRLLGRELNSLCSKWQRQNACLTWPEVNSQLTSFSKSPNSQPIASRHDVIHTPAHFLSGVYYDNCHILCARA